MYNTLYIDEIFFKSILSGRRDRQMCMGVVKKAIAYGMDKRGGIDWNIYKKILILGFRLFAPTSTDRYE